MYVIKYRANKGIVVVVVVVVANVSEQIRERLSFIPLFCSRTNFRAETPADRLTMLQRAD